MSNSAHPNKRRRLWERTWSFALCVTVMFVIFCLALAGDRQPGDDMKSWQRIVLVLWLIGPPLWFYLEWSLLTSRGELLDDRQFERFQFAQEVAGKVWLGISAALVILYSESLPTP